MKAHKYLSTARAWFGWLMLQLTSKRSHTHHIQHTTHTHHTHLFIFYKFTDYHRKRWQLGTVY